MNKHVLPVIGVIIVCLLLATPFLNLANSKKGDWRNSDTPGYHFIEQYVIEDGDWPLWDHTTFGGRPLFGFAMPLLHPVALLFAVFLSAYGTLNLLLIVHILLAGLGMYLLSFHLFHNEKAAVISAVLFVLTPYFIMHGLQHPFWVYGISYIPLELWLVMKAVKSKRFLPWSVGLGVVGGLHFLSGGVLQWYYAVGSVVVYLIVSAVSKHWQKQAVRNIAILIIFLFFTFSLASIRLLPGNEYTSFTNRGEGLPQEEILRVGHLSADNAFDTYVYSLNPDTKAGSKKFGQIGFVGLLLAIYAIYWFFKSKTYKNNKDIWFLLILALLIAVFASGMFLDLLYNVPGVSAQRGLDRSLIIHVVVMVLLAGLGTKLFLAKFTTKNARIAFAAVLLLGAISVGGLSYGEYTTFAEEFDHYSVVENNSLFQYMAEDDDIFRFHVREVSGIDYNNWLGSSAPLQLESLYGTYGGGWDSRYFHVYLASTFRSPAKLWGMSNMKYLVSAAQFDDPDYTLVESFDDLPLDTISNANYEHEAHLYRNNKFLPRAFFPGNAILLLGDDATMNSFMYALLTHPSFEPSQAVIVQGEETVISYSPQELAAFDIIILGPGSLTGIAQQRLELFIQSGGSILPNVFAGEETITEEGIVSMFSSFPSRSNNVTISSYYRDTPNKMTVEVENSGVLFISDKFTLYPGWTVTVDGKEKEILLANGVLSALVVPEGAKTIVFSYYPDSFRKGRNITFFAILVLIVYLVYEARKAFKRRQASNKYVENSNHHSSPERGEIHQGSSEGS